MHGSPPSETLGKDGIRFRRNTLIGRPEGHYAFPVSLYNKALATLENALAKCSEGPDATEYHGVSRNFLRAAIKDYDQERERWAASKFFFERIFGEADLHDQFRIKSATKNTAAAVQSDFCVVTNLEGCAIPRCIGKVKKENKVKEEGDPYKVTRKSYRK